ncbi:MAG: transketolase [Chloroflexota bacterium]
MPNASPGSAVTASEIAHLEEMARRIRVAVVRTVHEVRVGHVGGPLSQADILAALYFRIMRIRPREPEWPDRDRFVLSKGHASLGQYAAMALRGYLPLDELATFDQRGSRLQGHPDMNKLPGIEMSTGSLGMGLSVGMGMALGARLRGRDVRAFVVLGDGECQEGQVWEAAFAAPRHGLDNLIAIIDHNKLQQFGWRGESAADRLPPADPGELAAKFNAFGWRVLQIDGNDMAAVVEALETACRPLGKPVAIVADTVKGKGVSFMEGDYRWHIGVPTDEQLAIAMADLGEADESAT